MAGTIHSIMPAEPQGIDVVIDYVATVVDEERAIAEAGACIVASGEEACVAIHLFEEEDEEWDPASADPETKAAYDRHCRNLARERIDDFLSGMFVDLKADDDGRLRVWRAIGVSQAWTPAELAERPLGRHWAWDVEHAEAHWNRGDRTVILEGLVEASDVDWQTTVMLAGQDHYTTGEEREILMSEGAHVEIVALWTHNLMPIGLSTPIRLPTDETACLLKSVPTPRLLP